MVHRGPVLLNAVSACVVLISCWASCASIAAAPVRFNRDIRPILSDRCFLCHGPERQRADLRLDLRDSAVEWVIVPGDSANSELMSRISAHDDESAMPPRDSHKPRLTAEEVDVVRRWIDEGAVYESHWAFSPPIRPTPPAVGNRVWARNAIDRFVSAKLETQGIAPQAQADRRTLIRRVTLDLTGLSPTRTEIEAYLADSSPDAYEKVVDRLLASQQYGEHQARYWLDVARYADTNGYQYDLQREQWVWRDWVIDAFNKNLPFDRFTIEQLAGDLLADATDQTRLATGMHRNHPITIEGGVIDEEYRTEYVMDRVSTTSTAWLGLTMGCARCHDHKYDPISQREFYSMFAFFNNVPERGLNGFDPKAKIVSPLRETQLRECNERIARIEQKLDAVILGNSDYHFSSWLQRLIEHREAWTVIPSGDLSSTGGSTLTRLEDGSVLASGTNPDLDTYEYTFVTNEPTVRGLRLEALPDESFAHGSVGRAHNGNFVLSEIEVAAGKDTASLQSVSISSVDADYQQSGYAAELVIDGKSGRGGWAVDGNVRSKPSTLVLTLSEPIQAGTTVRVRLVHSWGSSHSIGRFRLATTGPNPPLPQDLLALRNSSVVREKLNERAIRELVAQRFGDEATIALCRELDKAREERRIISDSYPATMIVSELESPRQTYVLDRGEYDKPLKHQRAFPAVPKALGSLSEGTPANRLGLAQWIVADDNPLTARVIMNRYWAQFFGRGLVTTIEDFGSQGAYPTHPDLLDWLAVEFRDSGWNVKHMLRTIVVSNTYRQSSSVAPVLLARDPNNRDLSRGAQFRLDAESIRDSALLVSGLLDHHIGGPSVYPYHPKGLWLEINNRPGLSAPYPHTTDTSQLYRRSMYTFWKRTVAPPSLTTFDAPDREYCVVSRSRTNTPLQAFVLLHDPQFVEAARALAERMIREGGDTLTQQLAFGFEVCTSREATAQELAVLKRTYEERLRRYRDEPSTAESLLSIGESPRDASIDPAVHAAMTTVARLLLNLSEFITKS